MKKGFFAVLAALVLSLFVAAPAFAAELNDSEQKVYDEFCAIVDKYDVANGGWLASSHAKQYKEEARSALLNEEIDLDDAAAQEFSDVLDKIDPILAKCNSQRDAWNHYDEIVGLVNGVANKYDMNVSVDADDFEAHVVVKQTGFGLAQTAFIAGAAVLVLCGAFAIAKKNNLFA